jgi:biopolymer transport protein TolR
MMKLSGPAGGRGRVGELSEINVTPLVDVMLVLLIIFMVAAPMMTRGVDVELPEIVKSEAIEEERVEVTLDRQGQLWIAERPVTAEALEGAMSRLARVRPGSGVFLRADARTAYGNVLKVMDLIRRSGVERVAMVTLPADAPARAGR